MRAPRWHSQAPRPNPGSDELAERGGPFELIMPDGEQLAVRPLGLLQRRDYVRVRVTRTVLLEVAGGLAPVECASVDLSGGGMLLGGLERLAVGERVGFRLRRGGDADEITGSGIVVRSDAGGRRAIELHTISDGARRRLIRFLFDCQREQQRQGLRGGLDEH